MATKKEQIEKILAMTSQEVAMLGVSERLALFIALQRVEVAISEGLGAWAKGVTDVSVQVRRKDVRALRKATVGPIHRLKGFEPELIGQFDKTARAAVALSDSHVLEQYQGFAVAHGELPLFSRVAVDTQRVTKLLIDRYPRSIARYRGNMERHLRRQFELSHLRGESIDAMVNRIIRLTPARRLETALPKPQAMARGLMQKARSDMSRLIRTEAIYAYNVMQLEGIKGLLADDETIRKRWDASLDRRGCPTCRGLDGEIQKTNEPFSSGVMASPEHPHCRCTVVAWSARWK